MHSFITPLFQPVWDLEFNVVAFFEALLRIRADHTRRGHVELLAIAEKYGFIQHLDIAVIDQVLTALDYIETPIAVNVSSLTIKNHMQTLLDTIERRSAHADRLIVDISDVSDETVWPAILQFAAKARRYNIRFELDDDSPLDDRINYIQRLKPEFVKVGRRMLSDALNGGNERDLLTLEQVVRSNGGYLLASHVEDLATIGALRRFGVRYAQGYSVGVPSRVAGSSALTPVVLDAPVPVGE